jgi:predicted P-loop ATPase
LYVQCNSEILHNVRWNDFAEYAEIQRAGKWERLTDADLLHIATKIEEHAQQRVDGLQVIQSWSINKNNVLDIITEFAKRVNPVKTYFEGLQWDGVERIPTLFHDVLGADKNAYTAAAAKLFLLGIVSRVYNAGCKFDYMIVLQGAQGLGKSAFFKALAINDDWYGSIGAEHMRDTKRLGEDSAGRLILEYEELNGIRKTDNEALKATITRTNDIYRKSYGTISESHKRKFVLVGTTNNGQYLTDPTGNRRYLPVPVTKKGFLDAKTVDQIWAETMHIYKAGGFNLYFDDTTDKAADEYREQATSLISDDYTEKIDEFVNMPTPGIDSVPMQFVQWIDVYTALGNVFKGMTNTQAKRIICEALERMGWERTRKRTGNSNNAVWGYERPKS